MLLDCGIDKTKETIHYLWSTQLKGKVAILIVDIDVIVTGDEEEKQSIRKKKIIKFEMKRTQQT